MFQFPPFASLGLCIQPRITTLTRSWVFPFGNLRIKAYLAAPRSLSQLITSFFAVLRQGIHHILLVA